MEKTMQTVHTYEQPVAFTERPWSFSRTQFPYMRSFNPLPKGGIFVSF